ncbi:MAG: DNA polymerase III subunit beta [Actinomycetota bacterium]
MKFRCERDDLLEAVQFATRAISNRATLPVLSGLRIEAGDDGVVRLAATDLELTIEASFKAGVDEPGRAIVPGRLFGEMSRNLGAGQVSLMAGDGEVEIGSGRGQFRVKSLATDDYPALPIEDASSEGDPVEVDAAALATALAQVVRAASTDESRQVLTGVVWEFDGDKLSLAATDSYRLAVAEIVVSGGPKEARKVILPSRAIQELVRVLQSAPSTGFSTVVRENLISFFIQPSGNGGGGGGSAISSRFIEGEFPNYRQLLPEGYKNTLTVDKDDLIEVVRRVGLLAQNNLPVKLQLGAELEVSAHTPDVGEGQELLDAVYEGEPFVIAFNPQFLYDGASAIHTDKLVLQAGDGLKPAILKGENDTRFTYLLMPVRLS